MNPRTRRRHPQLAWLRYGEKIPHHQLTRAAGRIRAAILQPWERDAAATLAAADPGCEILAYQCLSSVRDYEPGPLTTGGLSPEHAQQLGTYATKNGRRLEWAGYPGHWQQNVTDPTYRTAWANSVYDTIDHTAFTGVFADNDVYDDYYNLRLPIDQIDSPATLRAGLSDIIHHTGGLLQRVGLRLLPNIAEARRSPGRWEEHASYGGGVEECWMAWGTTEDTRLPLPDILAQVRQLTAPGLSILRTPGTGEERDPHLQLALAAAWVFAPHSDVAVTATAHDGYSVLPLHPAAGVDLGRARGPRRQPRPGVFTRRLAKGYAAINLSQDSARVGPRGEQITLDPWRGYLWGASCWEDAIHA